MATALTSLSFSALSSFFLVLFLLLLSGGSSASRGAVPTKIGKGYRLVSIEETSDGGLLGYLEVNKKNNIYGPDIPRLQLFFKHENQDRLRVRITDAEKPRWEVPYDLLPREKPPTLKPKIGRTRKNYSEILELSGSQLSFSYTIDPFTFVIKRNSNGQTLFDTSVEDSDTFNSLVFKDQYLEISTKLPKNASLYGLGENTQPHGIKLFPNDPYTIYSTDLSPVVPNADLYGSHPVYMDLRNVNGQAFAHAVLLLNSNGMDVFYRGNSLTYKVIGGVFDLYFFAGPSPLAVVDQYTSLVGRPAPMPYWGFGFHQCRFGYQNVSVIEDVVENYQKARIPLDVIWTDDDHMDAEKDFSLSPINFPRTKLRAFLEKIHKIGMHYVVIVDPGIAVNNSYDVYKRAMANDVFIKYEGEPYVAQVWPGAVHFPDFLSPKTISWWGDEIRRFHDLVPVDGLWIDMNEASNFCTGKCTIPKDKKCPKSEHSVKCCLDCKNITNTRWDDPPYKINVLKRQLPIGFQTIATSAVHYNGVLEYDAHSLYGFSESIATYKGIQAIQGKRPFILSRSTFVGSGKYVAHWTGDNNASWDNLRYSISTMLNFGIFGIPMVGSDICGFFNAPTEELCSRWIELGAFYPFARDHSSNDSPRQELYLWDSVAKSARNALGMRYKLLPYFYTLNYESHVSGAPIVRPLFFSFPSYTECYGLSSQFLLGGSVMISPVLDQGKNQVTALFPPGSWYSLLDLTQAIVSEKGTYVTLDAPLSVINVHVYQNFILPMQQGGVLTKEARMTPFNLVVTFPFVATNAKAKGSLFLDDDELPEMKLGNGASTYVDFYATVAQGNVKVWSEVQHGEFAMGKGWIIEKVYVLGLTGISAYRPALEVDGMLITDVAHVNFNISEQKYMGLHRGGSEESVMIEVRNLNLFVGKNFAISWNMQISK